MSGEVKAGLTLPWLWVALIVAYLALGFMLPPLDAPLKVLAKTKIQTKAPDNIQNQSKDLVF